MTLKNNNTDSPISVAYYPLSSVPYNFVANETVRLNEVEDIDEIEDGDVIHIYGMDKLDDEDHETAEEDDHPEDHAHQRLLDLYRAQQRSLRSVKSGLVLQNFKSSCMAAAFQSLRRFEVTLRRSLF